MLPPPKKLVRVAVGLFVPQLTVQSPRLLDAVAWADQPKGIIDVTIDNQEYVVVNVGGGLSDCSMSEIRTRARELVWSELHKRDREWADYGLHDYGEAGA